jgi:CRISPR/Cas system-associated exonuclease Cas4 (RecB family)
LFKKEFDIHRVKKEAHPLMKVYEVDAVPFQHKDLNTWRENFEGIQYFHEETGMTISGAVDDLWITPDDEIIVVDYKSTSKDQEVTLDDKWKEGYKRQMEVYQWLLRKLGFKVKDKGYFVYANGRTDKKAFDGKLEFYVTLLPYEGNTDWVEDTIYRIKETLDSDKIPVSGEECQYCSYIYAREKLENAK